MIPALIAGMLMVSACGQGSGGGPSGGSPSSAAHRHLHGVMHGGQNPVAGATVTLYGAAIDGFGSTNVTVLGTAITDSNGRYSLTPAPCPSNIPGARSKIQASNIQGDATVETYIVATGGDSGSGPNSAIGLMAAIGACDKIQNSTVVNINELTTVAGEWALQQFADSTGQNIGAPSGAQNDLSGLANAYDTIFNLADQSDTDLSVSGNPSSFLPTPAQCASGSPPVNCDGLERLDTLADILAACVNSSGSASTACQQLFCYATPATPAATFSGGNCSVTPQNADTLQAASSIAFYRNTNIAGLFGLAQPNAPFEPTLASVPDGWEIALNYAPAAAAFSQPSWVAVDTSGNLFISNQAGANSSASELTIASSYTTAFNFNNTSASGANFNNATTLALDSFDDLFVVNNQGNSVTELANSNYNTATNLTPGGAAFNLPLSSALDFNDNLFVTNLGSNSISVLPPNYTTGSNFSNANTGSPGAQFDVPVSVAADQSGNVFVVDCGQVCGGTVGDAGGVSYLMSSDNYATGSRLVASGATFNGPSAIAEDSQHDVFVTNTPGNNVSVISASGGWANGENVAPSGAALNAPKAIAVDGDDVLWVVNSSSVSELFDPATGYNFAPRGANFNGPASVAIDGSGNLWIPNFNGNSVSELIGMAGPVSTPQGQSAGGAGRAGVAIIVFLTLMTLWYGRKYRSASEKRTA